MQTQTLYTDNINNRYWQCRQRHCMLTIETICTDNADTDTVYWQYQQYVLTMQTKTLYNYINNANNLEFSLGKRHSGDNRISFQALFTLDTLPKAAKRAAKGCSTWVHWVNQPVLRNDSKYVIRNDSEYITCWTNHSPVCIRHREHTRFCVEVFNA